MMMRILAATAALAALSVAAPAFANDDTVFVAGVIAPVCTISAPSDQYVSLTGPTALGNITVQCNDAQGFTAGIASLNSGKLKDANSTTTYSYQLSVAGLPPVSLTNAQLFNTTDLGVSPAIALSPVSVAVGLTNVSADGPAYAGTYSDVLTFSINGN